MVTALVYLLLLVSVLFPIPGHSFDPSGDPTSNQDSRACLSCHDGTLGRNIISDDLRVAAVGFYTAGFDRSGHQREHPIGIDYFAAMSRSRGRLKHPAAFYPGVKLENGYVGCTSCHDVNSRLRARLVISNRNSQLCYSCHNL